jgi:hypothetical protein
MGALAAIALGAAVLGGSLLDTPDPVPLTDVQREMIESGMFEPDSVREPAFEALVENVRSWQPETNADTKTFYFLWQPETLAEAFERERGELTTTRGDVRMTEPLGDAFPGVTRVTIELMYWSPRNHVRGAMLVFLVDEEPPEIGSHQYYIGRLYKVMQLPTNGSDTPTAFPAIVARSYDYEDPSDEQARQYESMKKTGAAIITALTGALAVVFFVVVMGRHMLGRNNPPRLPLASTVQTPDDAPDA